jgi:hypothetical protein
MQILVFWDMTQYPVVHNYQLLRMACRIFLQDDKTEFEVCGASSTHGFQKCVQSLERKPCRKEIRLEVHANMFGITGKICRPFLARFLPSLTEASHVAWRGAPLEMTEGTKGGAQRAHSLRPRCIGKVVHGPWRQYTIYMPTCADDIKMALVWSGASPAEGAKGYSCSRSGNLKRRVAT